MGLTLADFIFSLLIVGLLIIIFFLYGKNKRSLRTNIGEILKEYKELKKMAEKLRSDADAMITRGEEEKGRRENLRSESNKLREALFDVRQKSKSDVENAVRAMKAELKDEMVKEIDKITPEMQPKKEAEKERILALNDEHINVLHKLASVREELALEILNDHFNSLFPNKEKKNFQVVIRDLTENNLIREAYTDAGDFYYTISNQGIVELQKHTS